MTDRRWPILDLDDGATESEIRRAYAKRLRELGPDADVVSFQALRAEFDHAVDAARSGSARRSIDVPDGHGGERGRSSAVGHDDIVAEITQDLADGELVRACDRYDHARVALDFDDTICAEIEERLGGGWLADTSLDDAARMQIVARYHWLDIESTFPLTPEIMVRLHVPPRSVRRPGESSIGRWNWGAFLLAPFWLMAHGLKKQGARFLVFTVAALIFPFGFIVLIIAAIRYGKSGNALAATHRTFTDDAQFAAVQNAWRNWGIGVVGTVGFCVVALTAMLLAAH